MVIVVDSHPSLPVDTAAAADTPRLKAWLVAGAAPVVVVALATAAGHSHPTVERLAVVAPDYRRRAAVRSLASSVLKA